MGAHMLALLFALVNIALADWKGLQWMRGKVQTLPARSMWMLHNHIWMALAVLILSGAAIATYHVNELMASPAFGAKLAAIVALTLNGVYIRRTMRIASEMPFAQVPAEKRRALYLSGIISTIAWATAIVAAGFILPE